MHAMLDKTLPFLPNGRGRTRYEVEVEKLDIYPTELPANVFMALGLAGEAGEVADKIKKLYRGNRGITTEAIALELGDVLWYLVRMANILGYTLEQIMSMNLEKLWDRHARGAVHGEGDKR